MARGALLAAVIGLFGASAFAQTVVEAPPNRVEQSIYTRSEHPALFDAVKLRTSDLLEAAISVEDKAGKVVYAPFLYGLAAYNAVLSEARFQLSQKDNLTSLALGTVYNPTSPRSKRGVRLFEGTKDEESDALAILKLRSARAGVAQKIDDQTKQLQQAPAETADDKLRLAVYGRDLSSLNAQLAQLEKDLAKLETAEDDRIKKRIVRFDEALVATSVPVVGITYSATLFQVLGGTNVDADKDGLWDNARKLKRHSLGLSAEVRPSLRWMVSTVGVVDWERGSAEAESNFARFVGFGATIGGVAMVLNKSYRDTEDYRTSLFIPSVVLGGAFEGRWCQEDTDLCPDRKKSETAVTPFLDFKIARTAQFRLGIPVKRVRSSSVSRTELAAVTSFSVQLGQPK